jgi:hypothetical protein
MDTAGCARGDALAQVELAGGAVGGADPREAGVISGLAGELQRIVPGCTTAFFDTYVRRGQSAGGTIRSGKRTFIAYEPEHVGGAAFD